MLNKELEVDKINRLIQQSLPEEQRELVSDGYHTFKELYDHRVSLFIALCNSLKLIDEINYARHGYIFMKHTPPLVYRAWKSKQHADGTIYNGWYIAGIGLEPGETITYHLPIDTWDSFRSPEVGHAPEWDGHTSEDVLKLLRNNF